LQVNFSPQYLSYKKKFKKDSLMIKRIDDTIDLFINDNHTPSLKYKKITCKKDKARYSIRIIGTQYRILMTIYDSNYADLKCICSHDEYSRINKNC